MECPHCKKELELRRYAWEDFYSHKDKVIATTLCCENMIQLVAICKAEIHHSDRHHDDYGVAPK